MFRRHFIAAGLAGLVTVMSAAAPAHAASWTLLGTRTVDIANVDRDVFYVGASAGRFEALRFTVHRNRVAIGDVKVFYGNGTTEHLNVREHVLPGTTTPAYDLKGDHRVIEKIEVIYQTEGSWKYGRATMQIYGLRDGAPTPPPANWVTLGTQSVQFTVDHDTILVGASHGKFRKIMLKVRDDDVFFYNLRVRFLNGEEQEIGLPGLIRAGHSSGVLDLSGDKRFIDRIDIVYRSRPGFTGRAHVTVLGEH